MEKEKMADFSILEPLEMDVTKSRYMDGWDYEPSKYKWLADRLWWALRRIGAVKTRMSVSKSYRLREPRNAKSVVDSVIAAIRNAEQFFYKPGSYSVVMGYETYRELMEERSSLMPMGGRSWEFTVTIGYNGEMFGVPVHVVEMVKGVAVIPKVVIEHNARART